LIFLNLLFHFLGKLFLVRGTLLYVSFAADRSSAGRDTNRNGDSKINASRNGDQNGSGDKSGYSKEGTNRNEERNGNRSPSKFEDVNVNGDDCGDGDKVKAVVVNDWAAEDGVEVRVREEVTEAGEAGDVLGEEEEDAFMQALISITRPLNKVHDSSANHCKTETGRGTEREAETKTKTDGQHSSKKRRRDDGVDAGAGAGVGAEGGAAGYAGSAGGCEVSVRYKEVRFIIGPAR
jgi:hypothetical protein